jgi:hypothetical protein
MADMFVSYTSNDRASWIGHELVARGDPRGSRLTTSARRTG